MRAAQHDTDSDDEPEYHRVEITVKIPYPPGFYHHILATGSVHPTGTVDQTSHYAKMKKIIVY